MPELPEELKTRPERKPGQEPTASLTLEAYKGFERWDTTREAHIAAVYATFKGTQAGAAAATR